MTNKERIQKNNLDIADCIDLVGTGGGTGGDNTVIDVEELPTENIDQGKIYRVTKQGEEKAEVWVVSSDMDFAGGTMQEVCIVSGMTDTVVYFIVDEIPTNPEEQPRGFQHIYIVRSTGEPYMWLSSNGLGPASDMFDVGYRGFISDPSEATEDGLYTIMSSGESSTTYGIPDEANNKTVFEHTAAGGWVECGAGGSDEPTETAEVYVNANGLRGTLVEYLAFICPHLIGKELQADITYEIVDELPAIDDVAEEDRLVIPDENTEEWKFKCFILRSNGEPYVVTTGNVRTTVSMVFATLGYNIPYCGMINSPEELAQQTESGFYTVITIRKMVFIQEKTVDITENGTTEVLPDEGFALSKVTVNANIEDTAGAILDGSISNYSNNEITSLRGYAFYENKDLLSVDFPEVSAVKTRAFAYCTNLKTVNMPKVKTVADNVFDACSNLISISLPLASTLNGNVFRSCRNLTSVNLPQVTQMGNYSFYECMQLQSIVLPELTTLRGYTFYYCIRLVSADLPKVSSVNSYEFCSCFSLRSVILRSGTMVSLSSTNAFDKCYHVLGTKDSTYNPNGDKDGYIYVPSALVDSYKSATNWSTFASQFRALEDYTVDGTTTGALDESKI